MRVVVVPAGLLKGQGFLTGVLAIRHLVQAGTFYLFPVEASLFHLHFHGNVVELACPRCIFGLSADRPFVVGLRRMRGIEVLSEGGTSENGS